MPGAWSRAGGGNKDDYQRWLPFLESCFAYADFFSSENSGDKIVSSLLVYTVVVPRFYTEVCASYNKDRLPHSSLEPAVRIPGENLPTFFKKTLLIKTPRGADGRYMLATRPGGVYSE